MSASTSGRSKRRLRNYIIYSGMQFRLMSTYVAVMVGTAFLLGVFLWSTSKQILETSKDMVDARISAAQARRDLDMGQLGNLLQDPGFVADPMSLTSNRETIEARFEAEKRAALEEREKLITAHRARTTKLAFSLAGFALVVALSSIVLTHKIAGPLHRMRSLMSDVLGGRRISGNHTLRRGDELREFFGVFCQMLDTLRSQELADWKVLSQALHADDATRSQLLVKLAQEKRDRLQLPELALPHAVTFDQTSSSDETTAKSA